MTKIYKRFLRLFFWLGLSLLGLFLLVFWTLQIPYVQGKLVFFIVDEVEAISDHHIELERVSINWFDVGVFNGVEVYDFRDSLMFRAEEVVVNFDLFKLYRKNQLSLDGIHISQTMFRAIKHNDSTSINISEFISSLSSGQPKKEKSGLIIRVDEIVLTSFEFQLSDLRKDSMSYEKFDYNHIYFDIPALRAVNTSVIGDSVSLKLLDFSAKDKNSPLKINKFACQFSLDKNNMILDDLELQTPESTIRDSIALGFSDPSMLSYFIDSVTLDMRFKNSVISTEDIKLFANIQGLDERFDLAARFKGKISRLFVENLDIKTSNGSYFKGKSNLIGLPSIKDTFIELDITESWVRENDIHKYSEDTLLKTGDFSFTGDLLGFLNDFVANGRLVTKHGVLVSDLNLKHPESPEITQYIGNLELRSFDLGAVVGRREIGRLDFKGTIEGTGLTKESADLYLNAKAKNIEVFNHRYKSLKAEGHFASKLFSGSFFVEDSILKVSGMANIDFSQEEEIVDFTLEIDTADLYEMGIVDKPFIFSTNIDVDVRNFDLNSARGKVTLDNTLISREDQSAFFDQMRIVSINLSEQEKLYELQGSGINAKLKGDFLLTQLINDIPLTLREFWLSFTNDQKDIREYYINAETDTTSYKANLELSLININPYLDILNIPIKLSKKIKVESSFQNSRTKLISIYSEIDTIIHNDRKYLNNIIDINASKESDSTDVLAVAIIESEQQYWDVVSPTSGFFSEIVWYNNQIDLSFDVDQKANNSSASITSSIELLKDTIQFYIRGADLVAFDREWEVRKDNMIRWIGDKIFVRNFELYNQSQSVIIEGVYSDSLATKIDFRFDQFNLENLSAILPRKFEGQLNANGSLTRTSPSVPLRFESDLDISQLVFEGYKVGDLSGYTNWDNTIKGLDLSCEIKRNNIKTIQVRGTYIPEKEQDQLDLSLSIDQANINLIQPIFEDVISNVGGYASGNFSIKGALESPEINGSANLSEGIFTFDYLNTTYRFSGPVRVSKNEIAFDNIDLRDRFQDPATLGGSLEHTNFKNFKVDVDLSFQDFELLNTTARMNSLYHGNIYATGVLKINGPLENIAISSTATTRPNTRVFIPVTETTEVGQGSYINFINPNIADSLEEDGKSVDLSGITLDFDIDVTPDAYVELIFDPRTGDIIRGRGNGNLQLNIDTNGDFEMFGGLEINSGAYNFTTSLINKEFQIRPGGTITWYGDPYNGLMDLEATYRQIADVNSYYSDSTITSSDKRPVLVVLSLEGSMLSPNIDFSIELEQGTNLAATSNWSRMLQEINSEANNQELKRQVFSLLILRKFSPRQSFAVGGIQDVGSSVSEFLSNQLSYWLNQVDENLEVDIDLASLNQEAFNTFQLRLAYTFFDGRLRVTRGGALTTAEESSATVNNILGDWSVEYLLTEDGNLRIKIFSRNQQSFVQSENEQSTGVSLQYIKSFNELSDLLGKAREKAIRRKEEDNEDPTD